MKGGDQMEIKFESDQQYQLDAINAVVNVFEGQTIKSGQYELNLDGITGSIISELGYANYLELDEETLLANVQKVQKKNGIEISEKLDGLNFSIEMETGTGKTYVYLRTIFELNVKYGFTKFVIVVPSVAIREGVLKNLEITKEHFKTLYGNIPYDYWVYDSNKLSSVRQFATSNQLQIMIINIDSFNKESNVMNQERDELSGRKPIEFIQSTNPIVIIDEPQNMESDKAKEAIQSLNPLCTLRYSATHRNVYNLLYSLNPVAAYDLNLVKRIEVDSILDDPNYSEPYILVKSIKATKTKVTAKLEIDINTNNGPERKTKSVHKNGTDLYEISGYREAYKGYIVDYIYAGHSEEESFIAFTNGTRLQIGQAIGNYKDEIMQYQIYKTIENHFEQELRIKRHFPEGKRLKVLSLFFIDKVANYAEEDGKIRRWFVEAYNKLSKEPMYQELNLPPVEEVHKGYFAKDSKGKAKDSSESRTTKADDEAYELIMRDKERLLSLQESLRFIFSHSALREGWDNPNVFQICTLNETKSEIKKRQEIGRGLRLPVDENGYRVRDPYINRLVVIANENYDDFAKKLQKEIEEDCNVTFNTNRIGKKSDRKSANLVPDWNQNPEFLELWKRIKHRTRYSVKFDTKELIKEASLAVKEMPAIEAPKLVNKKATLDITNEGVVSRISVIKDKKIEYDKSSLPDLIGYIQKETELTRGTIAEILIQSGRLSDVWVNPQKFLDQVVKAIKKTLKDIMVKGIQYHKINGSEYEMRLFEDSKIEGYINNMIKVKKSIYDMVKYDSDIEKKFAQDLDSLEGIKFFVKLPEKFKIKTPLGNYNPDWAIVQQKDGEEAKLYLVAETKSTHEEDERRETENQKIKCGEAHFKALENVEFKTVTDASELF